MKIPNGIISDESLFQGPVSEEPEYISEVPELVYEEPEPAPEEIPDEGDSEQWTIPQVPANADGWTRASLLPGVGEFVFEGKG
ncbi:hypothetical protein N7532_002580 [Penicillium argentinense]|uniref:Uncharacterized protein n=1 Tax=Penicillium argentinense TaxID=1131581 RepID=A0A9W9K1B6_9EURO|nr:uncharacterized protein N7532_007859 [Penicillium argentinense]XP_056478046.1 uncharacterized protein N7532_002580 [Penicillium argentinense]KAJ5089175.1 hypothetical protein N7532_007859 [Penicillium argentinense]KAJ5109935.1 hypothetical protein N7532_002580 [Penicillium argentinense]